MRSWLLALLVSLAWAAPAGAEKPFSLEQVMRAPVASKLVASRSGRRVAWVSNVEGRRNIWVAEGPAFAARKLTAYEDDDGQELTQVAFADDGELLVYVRGGDEGGGHRNAAGEVPNPASSTAGAEQAVWVVAWSGGPPRRIDAGSEPAISARGTIAYVNGGKLLLAPAMGEGKPKPIVVGGKAGEPRWSPDGGKLSFTSDRGDHAFVGVLDVASGSLRYLGPSFDRDSGAVWSRDGKRLAFVRSPARPHDEPEGFFTAPDRPEPWAIWIADAATGAVRELWHSTSDAAGSFPFMAPEAIAWTAGDRLLFPSEADGWQRLQSIPAAGGPVVALTPAGCETEDWRLSSDGAEVLFVSNCDDLDRRHLSRVPVGGGKVARVTSGEGIESSPAPLGDGRTLAYLASDVRRPARPFVVELAAAGAKPRELAGAPWPGDFPASAMVPPQPVLLRAADGLELHAQLFLPRGAAGTRHPAVIFLHGGPIRQMLLGWHHRGYYANAYAMNQYLANRGYVVLALNYRGGIGYGRSFRMASGRAGRGATEYQDVVAAGLYLRGRNDVDSRRIGLWGGSYGGYLTALGLGRNSDLFAAGVDFHGVHDWNLDRWAGSHIPAESARLAHDVSPVSSVPTWRSPVLFIHGDDDRNVAFGQSVDLVARLRERGVAVEQLVFPDEIHDFLMHRTWLAAYQAASDFLDRRLGTAR